MLVMTHETTAGWPLALGRMNVSTKSRLNMKGWNCSAASRSQKIPSTIWSTLCVPIGRQKRCSMRSRRTSSVATSTSASVVSSLTVTGLLSDLGSAGPHGLRGGDRGDAATNEPADRGEGLGQGPVRSALLVEVLEAARVQEPGQFLVELTVKVRRVRIAEALVARGVDQEV